MRFALTDVHANARLQDAVALGHPPHSLIEFRPVERMRQRANQAACRLERQLRVGIQRDDISHRRQGRVIPVADHEARIRRAAEQAIELRQLASLALPSHPSAFAWIPAPLAMEVVETIRSVAGVQLANALSPA